jgi:hypothetical protein
LTTLERRLLEEIRKQQVKSLHNKNDDRRHATGYECVRGWDIKNEENGLPVLNDGFSYEVFFESYFDPFIGKRPLTIQTFIQANPLMVTPIHAITKKSPTPSHPGFGSSQRKISVDARQTAAE